MTTAALLWGLACQAHRRAACADPGLAARHRRIETALVEAIKEKAVGGKPTAAELVYSHPQGKGHML
jgi:hypothetical protein